MLGGESIALDVKTGVLIVGKYEVESETGKICPWFKSDIKEDDIIISIDKIDVVKAEDIAYIINDIKDGENIPMTVKRDSQYIDTNIIVVQNKSGKNTIGLYVKDHLVGIGTLTFIDANKMSFAALGHSITDNIVNNNLDIGTVLLSSIRSVRKAEPGIPGEKQATVSNDQFGTINKNLTTGVYGKITNINYFGNELMHIASAKEVKTGKAEIVTVLSGNEKKHYAIEITEVKTQNNNDIKGIKFKVTDDEMLKTTGGIIQGMSGSPIIQNGKIIGAVSHVIVNNPNYGYAVYAEWMYNNL